MSKGSDVGSIIDWVESTCLEYSDSVVVTGVGEDMTFSEVWSKAEQLAHELVRRGVGLESRVGLWAEQSSDLLVGLIGIMAAGAAYVPLDPSYPKSRLEFIASDAGLSFVVAPDRLKNTALGLGIEVISATSDSASGRPEGPLPQIDGHNAAYVIYTSGSTGRPKGVIIEHHSVVDLLKWMVIDCDMRPGDRVMGTASPSFDASIPNLLLPLVTGGTFVALAGETTKDPYALADAIARYHPRALQASPTMLRMLTEIGWQGDRDVEIWAGSERTAASVIRYIAPRVRALCNYYGPTEATVQVSVARLGPDDSDSPVGTSPAHVECVLLDPDRRRTTPGQPGELFITGTQLARGYLNDPELTAKQFAPIDIGDGSLRRAYRTGDLARVKGDGSLLILGRVDDQIKIRGYRIEPSEIEQRLTEFPRVMDAIVLSHQAREADEPRLVAFIKSSGDVQRESLRAYASQTLPEYMIPSVLIEVDEFPLAPSGKIDKKQLAGLASVSDRRPSDLTRASPSDRETSELEQSVLGLFANVLDLNPEELGIDEDFFDLGGTSLRCVRLFMAIEERYHVALPPSTLATASTVRTISAVVSQQTLAKQPQFSVRGPSTNEWEWVLCIMCSEFLGLHGLTGSDNFFDLGGSPANALLMIEELRSSYGIELTLPELYEAPTISELAEVIRKRSNRSNLIPLNTAGSRTPFFCIAGPGGLALAFLSLCRVLGPEQPFYGLQAHGLERRGLPDFTLGRAAARHVRAIREVQPHGPYLIGGHSLGGAIALKVAHRLRADGEEVALLALFDSHLTRRMTGQKFPAPGRVSGLKRSPRRILKAFPKISNLLRLPLTGVVPQSGAAQFELFTLHGTIQARLAGRLRPWSGRAVVFVSEDEESTTITEVWAPLLTGPWSCIRVPGDHSGCLLRPHVTVLATRLQEEIAEALAMARPEPGETSASGEPSA